MLYKVAVHQISDASPVNDETMLMLMKAMQNDMSKHMSEDDDEVVTSILQALKFKHVEKPNGGNSSSTFPCLRWKKFRGVIKRIISLLLEIYLNAYVYVYSRATRLSFGTIIRIKSGDSGGAIMSIRWDRVKPWAAIETIACKIRLERLIPYKTDQSILDEVVSEYQPPEHVGKGAEEYRWWLIFPQALSSGISMMLKVGRR
ncbi:hypothetical protein Tco_0952969 [Tanacetum coccineum]|uniref:Uncharacterized protein n=1 Tax=Tanacetum coccineum TaxID=301880 RepID=A0ABQ5DZH5_9ASTR